MRHLLAWWRKWFGHETVHHHYHYSFDNITIRSNLDLEALKRSLRELEHRGR